MKNINILKPNKDNFKKGKQSLEGFTKLYGYLKEGDVIRGVQLSKGNIKIKPTDIQKTGNCLPCVS